MYIIARGEWAVYKDFREIMVTHNNTQGLEPLDLAPEPDGLRMETSS